MMVNQHYNFHRLIGFQLETQSDYAQDFFESEFAYHKAGEDISGSLVNLHWEPSSVPWKLSGKSSFHVHKLLARWFYRIELTDEKIEIAARGNQIALPMVHHMLVHPSLRYLCGFHGSLLLHGAGVVKNGRSLILTGAGGAGKTTTSSILLDAGGPSWGLHADDYVFLDHAGLSYGYLTRSHLYSDLLNWVENLDQRLTDREMLELKVFGAIRRLSGDRIKWPLRLTPEQMWPDRDYSPQARVAGVLILERGQGDQIELSELDAHQVPVESLLTMNFFEARHFIRLIKKSLPELEDAWLLDWRARERMLLEQMTMTIPFYRLSLPVRPSDLHAIRSQLLALVEPILEAA
jgi:hypothetical protein